MKLQIINIDSSRTERVILKNNVHIVNLNSVIKRYNIDSSYLCNQLSSIAYAAFPINFTNLASLCNKLGIKYSSKECYELVSSIIDTIKRLNPNATFCQCHIHNQGEIDMLPFSTLYELDTNNNILYLNKILKDKLKVIGYVDSQMPSLLEHFRNIIDMLPTDLFSDVALCTDENISAYCRLKELLY